MDKKQAADFVIRELGKHHQRNEIIKKICEVEGISWKDAERFVQQVETENVGAISRRQGPMVTFLGIATALGGLGVMIWVVVRTLQGAIITLFYVPYLGNLSYFFTGLVMMIAGLWGIGDTLAKIWKS